MCYQRENAVEEVQQTVLKCPVQICWFLKQPKFWSICNWLSHINK